MKIIHKYILSFLFLMITLSVMGQQCVIVGYGETFESIANKYGVSISELKASNPGKDVCYAGMELMVPQPTVSPVGNSDVTSPVLWLADSLLLAAKTLNISGDNKKAIKLYNKVLEMNVRTPYAYSGRGGCYFSLKKYKKAKDDLRQALTYGQLSTIEKEWIEEALEDVEAEIKAKRERRNKIWGKIGLGFAAAAAVTTAYVASEQSKIQNQSFQNSVPNQNLNLSQSDAAIAQTTAWEQQWRAQSTAQLNMMTQNAMIQAAQTKQRMNQAFNDEIKWRGEFTKNNGRQPTEYEVDQWYAANYPDLLESRIMARGKMYGESQEMNKKEKAGEDDRYKTDYNDKFNNRYSSGKDCVMCLGSGNCKTCDGKGWYYNSFNISKTVLCPNCDHDHNGKCSHCHGTGKNP